MAETKKTTSPGAEAKEPAPSPPTTSPGKGPAKPTPTEPTKKPGASTVPPKSKGAKGKDEKVTIVEKPTPKKHAAKAKPTLTKEQEAGLVLRRAIDSRRPTFRRQQWYEYKRLANSGWRKPTGVDSAMRRHFGYEQSVVRIGFRGPAAVRGLHPSGFQEVRIESVEDLAKVDPKTQAARVSGGLGSRKLKLVYAEADKRGVRVLNRRKLQ